MLKITSEGRKAALDLRLMLPSAKDDPQSKVNLAVENIYRIWEATKDDRLTQLVFCDLSTPKDKGFSVYDDMAEKLVKRGVPQAEIAFIQDYDADSCKTGSVSFSERGQDAHPFRQHTENGFGNECAGTSGCACITSMLRGGPPTWSNAKAAFLRQGNKNAAVQIYRYVTEGSFDAYMWQTLETKAKFITQVMSGDMTVRRIEDLDSTALTYAEVKAIASGNPLVIEKAQVDAELMKLTRLRSAHAEEQYRIRANLRHSHEEAQRFTERLANLQQDLAVRQDTSGDKFRIELDGQTLDNRGVAGELLLRRAGKIKNSFGANARVGKFAGFDLSLHATYNNEVELLLHGKNSYSARVTDTALGTIRSLESIVQGFEERAGVESDIRDSQKRAKELEAKVGAPFEHEKRYHHLAQRQSEIEEKLDLTRNQAPSQIETVADDEIEEQNSPKQVQTKANQHARKTAVCA